MDDLNIQAGVTVNAEQAERAFDNLGNKAQKMANEVTKAADKAGKATDGMGDGAEKGAEKFTRAESRMRAAIQKSTRELEMLGKTASQKFEAQLEFKGLDKAKFQPFLAELRKTEEAAAKAQAGISGIGDAAKVAGSMMAAAFSGAALLGVVGKVVSVQREFDVLNSSLKTVTGSSEAAERELSWLKTFAKETPFGLAQATQGFVKMKALGLDPTRAALTSFGNTASAMGKDLNQMIEAVADASTGEFERLKEFGIKAKKEGDSVSLTFQGVTTTIRNNATEITKYLQDIGDTQFGGAMEERAKTLDGTIAVLGDTWDELFRTVSQNNVGSLIFDSVTLANGALEDATTILKAMGGAAQDAGKGTGALSTIQNGLATVFETVSVLGVNLKYTLVGIGNEIGGLAAQVVQAAQFNFAGVRAIREQMVADAEEARRQVDLTTERILSARKEQERYASYATRNASAATDPRRIDLGKPGGDSVAAPSKPTKAELSDYDKLIQKLGQEIPKAAAEAEAAQMGYNKAQTEFLALAASPAWAKFTNAQRATVAALFENKIASEEAADAAKTLAKGNLDAAQSREKYLASLQSGIDKIRADITAQEEATARMGLSKEAIADLDAAKLEMLATDTELQAIKALDRNLDQQTYDSLKEQAKLYRDLAAAKRVGAAKETALDIEKANEEAAKKAAEDWQRASDDINRSLTDALLRGFESGKDFAKNLRDTIKNMFSTLVLRPIISAVVNPVAGAITGALGLAGTAKAGTSALSTVGSIGSGYSLLSGMGAFGGGISGGFGGLMGSLGLSATGSTLGGALSAGSIALQSGNILGGLGTFVGALGPIALGLGALTSLLGSFKGETRYGGGFEVVNGKAFRTTGDVTNTLPESAIVQSVQGTFDSINKILGQYGSEFVATNIKAGIETSGKGRGGVFAGGLLSGGGATDIKFGKFFEDRIGASLNPEEAVKAFGGELNKAVIAALQAATDLPKYVQRQIESVDVNALGADKAAELLQTIGNLPNVLLQGFGTTRDALAQQFAQGLALGDATAAGKGVADTLVASIEASLYNDAAGKIFDIVNSGIVAPMLDAIATGASVSEALSQATIDKTIERAKAQASALSELFGNAEFVSALEQIRTTVGAALGQAGDAFGYTPKYQLQAAQQIDTAAQSADQSAKDAAKAWEDINKALASDRLDADIALLRAMGQEEAALKKERERAIKGYDARQIAMYDGTQAILSQVTALEKQAEATKLAQERAAELASTLAGELPGAIAKFLSPDQKLSAGYTGIASDLSKVGINVDSGALATASLDQIAAAAMAVYNLGTTSDEARLALVRAASGLADLKAEATNLAASRTDAALAAVERAAQAQREVLQGTIDDVRAVFDAAASGVKSLRGQVDAVVQMSGKQGQAFIANALANARATGYLPDGKDLQDAISAVTAGFDSAIFTTQADADYQRLVVAGNLEALQSIGGEQLTEAEKALETLDAQLQAAHDQLDALRGIQGGVLSMSEALDRFGTALARESAVRGGGGSGGGGSGKPAVTLPGYLQGANGAAYDVKADMGYQAGTGLPWRGADVRSAAQQLLEAGNARGVYDAIKASGFTLAQADTILGLTAGEAEDWARSVGLPVFHSGTNFVPQTGLALLEKGEAVIPRAYNPAALGVGGNTERLERLVEGLTAEVQRLQAVVAEGNGYQENTANTLGKVVVNNALITAPVPTF